MIVLEPIDLPQSVTFFTFNSFFRNLTTASKSKTSFHPKVTNSPPDYPFPLKSKTTKPIYFLINYFTMLIPSNRLPE